MYQGGSDGQRPLHAPREAGKRHVSFLPQPEATQQFIGPLTSLRTGHAVQLAHEDQIVPRREFGVEIGVLRYHPHLLLDTG